MKRAVLLLGLAATVHADDVSPLLHDAFSVRPSHDLSATLKADESFRPQAWKLGITSTVFWAGEPPRANDPGNLTSAWDPVWVWDAPRQNAFYVALPYNDVSEHHTKPEAPQIIPWFRSVFIRDGQSVCKDRWVEIRHAGKVAYAQWEDVGPFQTDHWQYVFGCERPRPNRNQDAGIDVSPAVRDYLGLAGIDTCDWRFVSGPGHGPWQSVRTSTDTAALRKRPTTLPGASWRAN